MSRFDPRTFLSKVSVRNVTTFQAKQTIYRQGDPADAVFYIQSGKAKITVTSDLGKEAIVSFLADGDFFGDGCLDGQTTRLATAAALTDCEITRITQREITDLIHTEPAFAEFFIAHLLRHSIRTEEDLIDQLFNSSERRLARALLLLANFGQEDSEPRPVLAKISHETLAEIVGTTRSRVSFFMNKFRRLGYISYNGHIEVHPTLLNLVLQEKPQVKE